MTVVETSPFEEMRIAPYIGRIGQKPGIKTITGSGARLDLSSEKTAKSWRRRHKEWQDEAWHYYDTIGEIWFAQQFVGHCLSRVRLFAALWDPKNPDQPPQPIDGENTAAMTAINPMVPQAVAEVERWKSGNGGHGPLMQDFGVNLGNAGDCALVGRQVDGVEKWDVYSTDQLSTNSQGQFIIKNDPDDANDVEILEPGKSYVTRVWRPHPRWKSQADAPMRAVLDHCDELSILGRQVRSVGRSRLQNGILLIPTEASVTSVNPNTGIASGEGRQDAFWQDLLAAFTTPIMDEGSASAVVPFLVKMKGELIEHVKHLQIERALDPIMIEQRQELIKRIANGLDIPAQILLGLSDVNHWTAWQIDEQTYKAHIEPLVLLIVNALTVGAMWPAMTDRPDRRNLCVWFDPSQLVGHPDHAQDAKDLHAAIVISDDALRKATDFKDTDAPSPEERQRRVDETAAMKGRLGGNAPSTGGGLIPIPGDSAPGAPVAPKPAPPTNGTAVRPQPTPGTPTPGSGIGQPPALVGSGSRPRIPSGRRLAKLEDRTRVQLQESVDAVVFRALERAGAALRRKIGHGAEFSSIDGLPNWRVAEVLGQTATFDIMDEPELLAGLAVPLIPKYNEAVTKLQTQVRKSALAYDREFDVDALEEQQDEDRKAGALLLTAGVTTWAAARLFNPQPTAPMVGEFDRSQTVPPGLVRGAMARAGGATGTPTEGGSIGMPDLGEHDWATGVTSGTTTRSAFAELGLQVSDYTWVTGDPTRPFEPHSELSGEPFSSFTDEKLAADPGDWPYVDYYRPGDHLYCQCDFEIQWSEDRNQEQE